MPKITSLLPSLSLRSLTLLPIVQGGMGIGVSAHSLAGHVARCGALGTLSSVDLRRHHPDLMKQTANLPRGDDTRERIDAANLVALDREIKAARKIANGSGAIAVNIMRAVSAYAQYVRQACVSGADAIVVGAGLPLDLPDLTREFPKVSLIPILSDSRGVKLLVRKWMRRNRLPDAVILEHPRLAGGHLGAAGVDDINNPRFEFERSIPETLEVFEKLGIEPGQIPIIPAGGINNHAQIKELLALGASAVQLGTAFAVTKEGDAHANFKAVLAGKDAHKNTAEFISVAGLPARAVKTPWLEKHIKFQPKKALKARKKDHCVMKFDCLIQCGLRDGIAKYGQFCIDRQLSAAMNGDVTRGLFFRGAAKLPFGEEIRPVADLIQYLVSGLRNDDDVSAVGKGLVSA